MMTMMMTMKMIAHPSCPPRPIRVSCPPLDPGMHPQQQHPPQKHPPTFISVPFTFSSVLPYPQQQHPSQKQLPVIIISVPFACSSLLPYHRLEASSSPLPPQRYHQKTCLSWEPASTTRSITSSVEFGSTSRSSSSTWTAGGMWKGNTLRHAILESEPEPKPRDSREQRHRGSNLQENAGVRSPGSAASSSQQGKAHSSNENHRNKLIHELKNVFLHQLIKSIQVGDLVSFVLKGPTKTKKKKKSHQSKLESLLENDEILRGCIKLIQGRPIQIKGQPYLQITFKYHGATDIAKNWQLPHPDSIDDTQKLRTALSALLEFPGRQQATVITNTNYDQQQVQGQEYVPKSEWGLHYATAAAALDQEQLRTLDRMIGLQKASIYTTSYTIELDMGFFTKKPNLKHTQLPVNKNSNTVDSDHNDDDNHHSRETTEKRPAAVASHDRVKVVPLDSKAAFLQALGMTDDLGKPRIAMASKLRQCQKFVEIVGGLVDKALANLPASTSDSDQSNQTGDMKQQKQNQNSLSSISVLDMGCGRGYLTFSLHFYLQAKFERVRSVGIDVRPKLVHEINAIARSLGTDFDTISFEQGSIQDIMLGNNNKLHSRISNSSSSSPSLDILIALHACDTATDDALWCGISRQANIIVVAPCCHKQLRPQLNVHLNSNRRESHPLADILRHNVYRERHAEMVTDSMRALLLELAGYHVQVFEFIGGEHTAKNVMITAVRKSGNSQRGAHSLPITKLDDIQSRLEALASMNGIRQQKLAQWMIGSYDLGENTSFEAGKTTGRMSPLNMPPL